MIRVLLADDHAVVREGLKAILEKEGFAVVGEAADGMQAIQRATELLPDVAVIDFDMPLMNGINAAQELAKTSPRTKSILLTMYKEKQYVLQGLKAGIRGYVYKGQAAADLVVAIRDVFGGGMYASPGTLRTVVDAYLTKTEVPTDSLTPRENQVLQLIAEGKSTKQAARLLGISVKTAESHRTRMMEKLDIHETASLVRYAMRQGLIRP